MKKFIFKLEALSKLREFKEMKAKIEFGKVERKKILLNNHKNQLRNNIDKAYKEMETMLKGTSTVRDVMYYSSIISGNKAQIEKVNDEISVMEDEYVKKITAMRKARADLKLIDKIEEKSREQFKKEVAKKELIDSEDIIRMRKNGENKGRSDNEC